MRDIATRGYENSTTYDESRHTVVFGELEEAVRKASALSLQTGVRHKITVWRSAVAVQNRGKAAYWMIERI